MPRDASESCPLTILGGYLGAGKTTVLNHLLRQAHGRRIAVVVNDFGAINIDADLIDNRTADTLSITGGCVCCSFGDDLLETLQGLCEGPDHFDHIVIETSGVTLPRNLRASLSLVRGLQVVGTLILADAEAVQRQAQDRHVGDTVCQQLQAADLVLLSKVDLIATSALGSTLTWLAGHTAAPVLPVVQGEVPAEVLLGEFDWHTSPRPPGASTLLPVTGKGASAAIRARLHQSARYHSASFEIPNPVDSQALVQGLANLSPGLLRAKGFIRDDGPAMLALQLVGRRASVAPAASWVSGPGRLVTISAGPEPTAQAIRDLITASTRPLEPRRTDILRTPQTP